MGAFSLAHELRRFPFRLQLPASQKLNLVLATFRHFALLDPPGNTGLLDSKRLGRFDLSSEVGNNVLWCHV